MKMGWFFQSRREFSARKQDISLFQRNRVCNCCECNFCRHSIFLIKFKMAGLTSKQSLLLKQIYDMLSYGFNTGGLIKVSIYQSYE